MIEHRNRTVVLLLFIGLMLLFLRNVRSQEEEETNPPLEETSTLPETTTPADGATGVPGEETTVLPPININATVPSTNTTTPAPSSTRSPRDCVNLHPFCIFWKIHDECIRNPDFMEFVCRKTCKKCDTYPTSVNVLLPNQTASLPCSDDNDLCVFWSKRDQCNRNFYWMLQHCPFSCGYCSTKCRPCFPPSDIPPEVGHQSKLFHGTKVVQVGGIDVVDFTGYQPYAPPQAFGLYGDPDSFGRRRKRGKIYEYRPQHPKKHHTHGTGIGWTDLPRNHGYGCNNTHQPRRCATVAPLPCCIPVALAEAQGLLPLGAYVTPITPPTPSTEEGATTSSASIPSAAPIPEVVISTTTATVQTTSASETEVEITEPAPFTTTEAAEIPSPPTILQSTLEPAPEVPTELPDLLKVKSRLRKLFN